MRFHVRVLQETDGVGALAMEAADAEEAARLAKAQGHAVLSVKARAQWPGWAGLGARFGSGFQLTLFSQELLALLRAGLSLVEALETLAEKENRGEQRRMFKGVIASLYEGHALSTALERFPASFPALYVAAVRASEKTGGVAEALERYVAYQSQVDQVRKRIVSAAIYPALLLLAGSLVMLFLLLYVVPKFSRVYEDIGHQLPLFSQLLMAWGRMLEDNKPMVLAGMLGLAGGLVYVAMLPSFRNWLVAWLWRIPALGARLRIYQLARFYRGMSMLLHGGMPALSAMDMVAGLLPPSLRAAVALAASDIREGKSISIAMERQGLTTPVSQRLLRVGEHSGNMGVMMERIAGFHDDEMSRWVDWFTRLFEPVLMAVIGGLIGLIVLFMYLPIFELAGSIQ